MWRAVFLDLDGVLYDSLPRYVVAWKYAFQQIGVEFSDEEIYRDEGRRSPDTIIAKLRKEDRECTPELIDLVVQQKRLQLAKLPRPDVMPGAAELLIAINALKLPMWIVTGSTKPKIAEQLSADLGVVFSVAQVITGNDTHVGKPDPEPYREACRRSGITANQSLVIENAPLGIQSAHDCGCECFAINTGILADEELLAAGATNVFRNCHHLAEALSDALETNCSIA